MDIAPADQQMSSTYILGVQWYIERKDSVVVPEAVGKWIIAR